MRTEGQIGGQTDLTSLMADFSNFTNAPKNLFPIRHSLPGLCNRDEVRLLFGTN